MKHVLAVLLSAGLLASPCAGEERRDVAQLASSLAQEVIAPRFDALSEAFGAQAAAWEAGCQSPQSLRDAFAGAAVAWAQAEFFRSGPLSRQTRAERIDFWPDPRNATERGIKSLLAGTGDDGLTSEDMASASVAVQGLPALERLLYAQEGAAHDAAAPLEARACAVGRAIARNLAGIAAALKSEWREAGTGEAARLAAAATDPQQGREAAVAVLTDLATGLRVIEERKLPPLFGGKGGAAANPHAAKYWRSSFSARDIAGNLSSLAQAFAAVEPFAPQAARSVKEKLEDAAASLAAEGDANRAIGVQAALNNARYYALDVLPGELGVTLGFNSLDGD